MCVFVSKAHVYDRLECDVHGTFEMDGRAFCVTLELLFVLLLLLLLLFELCLPRITSVAGGHAGRGPGSGVYVNVNPVA